MDAWKMILNGLVKECSLRVHKLHINKLPRLRNRHFLAIDIIIFIITPLLALNIRLGDFVGFESFKSGLLLEIFTFLIIKLTILHLSGFYRRYWRYASIDELSHIATVMAVTIVLESLAYRGLYYLTGGTIYNLPSSIPLLDGLLSFLIAGGIRFSVRVSERISQQRRVSYSGQRILIVGAGSAGVSLVRDMQGNPSLGLCPVAFIDDDPKKLNLRILGLPVVGNRYQIPDAVCSFKIDRIVIAMPSVSGSVIRDIVGIAQKTEIQTRTLPGLHEILDEQVQASTIRDIQIEDLLRREPIQTDVLEVTEFLKGKRVLVTGSGGSIGSELCRQILKCHPAEIMLLGKGENSLFNIQQELEQVIQKLDKENKSQVPTPQVTVFVADIRTRSRLEQAFRQFSPEVIFHAAAHKHVPLMELNAPEAITGNVMGTKNLLEMALRYGVDHFVMISTDKAVNPTNVMGASKRVAEMLVLQAARTSGKPYVVVRFGNVLGSRGSVVPTFKRQIAAGGPVTITHPDIRRYFMTIPEAVQLVLQAAILGHGGEVCMLDMGAPVKIVDLAKDLIRLSGYEVGKDIDIVYTGLRPGEKLFEELFISGEQYEHTQHEKILIVRNASSNIPDHLNATIVALYRAANQNDSRLILFLLEQLVTGYTPDYSKLAISADRFGKHGVTLKPDIRTLEKLYQGIWDVSEHTHNYVPPQIERDLHRAIEHQDFQLYYQPIMQLETGAVSGFEALLYWQHPEYGLVDPLNFISVAEAVRLMVPIGWQILPQALRQTEIWHEEFSTQPSLTISINLSNKQFYQPDLSEQIRYALEQAKLNLSSLKLEINRETVMENVDFAYEILSKLRALKVQLQLDGLGRDGDLTLPSKPIYKQFDVLKIDSELVKQMESDVESLEIVKAIAAISHQLKLQMIAVGVETPGQLAQLKSLKCQYGQGYLFSKSLETSTVKALLENQALALLNQGRYPYLTNRGRFKNDPSSICVSSIKKLVD